MFLISDYQVIRVLQIMASSNRFASLLIESDSEKDHSNGKQQNKNDPQQKSNNKKRKNKKKRPQKTSQNGVQTNGTVQDETTDAAWVNRDEHLVSEIFHSDLKQALELSKLEYEKKQQRNNEPITDNDLAKGDNESSKVKKKNKTVSLEEFLHEEKSPQKENKQNNKKDKGKRTTSESFFDELEKEAAAIKKHEDDIQAFKNSFKKKEKSTKLTYKELSDALKWKEKHIDSLENCISLWKEKHNKLKVKFDHMRDVLQKGEMKENCKLVIEVEKLSKVRNELTDEVAVLNVNLQQEKSKSTKLKDEILRLQGKRERTTSS